MRFWNIGGGVSAHSELSDVTTPHVAADIETSAVELAKLHTIIQQMIIASKPIASWNFNDAITDDAESVDLTAQGITTYDATNKKFGSHAFTNDGSAVYMTHASFLDNMQSTYPNGVTMEFWFRPTNATSYAIAKANDVNNYFYSRITGGSMYFVYKVAGTQIALSSAMSINAYHHIVMIILANGDGHLYIDGVLVASDTTTLAAMFDGTGTFYVGNGYDGSSPVIGQLDVVRVYDKALTAVQVSNLYTRTIENWWT